MKVLVIGQGGREHALIKAFSQSSKVGEIHVVPGNPGMAREAILHQLDWRKTGELIHLCLQLGIDYVVIGPEDPLVEGLADRLRERGILVVGPSGEGAQLEGSKIYAKEFMAKAGVATARAEIVTSVADCMEAMARFTPPYVLKADGLAAGKGVYICEDAGELQRKAEYLFEKKGLGKAGERALLEQFQSGWELSFLLLTDGKAYQPLPLAQDHKRLGEGDKGPNTGGMGTVAPMIIGDDLYQEILEKVIEPSVEQLKKDGVVFRGVLFIGLMMTEEGPQVLEYNVRFGDPETQVILPLLDGDWGQTLLNLARGELGPLHWKKLSSACVVMAAPGYPENTQKDIHISGDLFREEGSSYFIHAGTARNEQGRWMTAGGRVLGAVGLGASKEEALTSAYKQARVVSWEGMQLRKDIGARAEDF